MRVGNSGFIVGAIAALAVLGGPLAGQQGTLVGVVTDARTGAPVAQAAIEIIGGGQNATTLSNAQGQFTADLGPGTYDLAVQIIGYVDARFSNQVRISAGQTTTFNFSLTSQAVRLRGIDVTGSRSTIAGDASEVPSTTWGISSTEIAEWPTTNTADHLREAPGVDVITQGLQATNVVVRGFNNIFSGALHMLTDHRLAGVPSLRVNLMHFIPSTEEDIERIEVVLGPGSALYGPNTANGIVHFITKSPLTSQGTSVTLGGGERSVFQGSMRSAFLLSDDFGFKISGQYMQGDEWNYIDPTEQAGREAADADPTACLTDKVVRGLDAAAAQVACDRLGVRDFNIERWSLEARADYRFADDGTAVVSYGRNTSSGINLTGLGAGQTKEWLYQFFQARVTKDRFFAQAYYNKSDAGGSFLLRDGVSLVDLSTLFVAQAQHGFTLADERQEFTFGVDYFATRPNSGATIYGSYENDDDINLWGTYVQSRTGVTDQLDLVLAGRLDSPSVLADNVFSPRAALVFKATPEHNVRFSYNKAFSTPSALNYYLDISGGVAPAPLGPLGYTTRAFGSGPNGFSLQNADGSLRGMRSPFNPGGAAQLLPADVSVMWQLAVGVLQAGGLPAATAGFLASLSPTNSDIARLLLDTNTGAIVPVAGAVIPDLPPIREDYTETVELGWTGIINNKVSISADAYYMIKNDFVSPLTVQTPLLLLSGADIAAYLTPFLGAAGAAGVAAAMAPIPIGVVSSDQVGAQGADLIASYRNVDEFNLWGADFAFKAFVTDKLTLSGMYSHMSKDYIKVNNASPISLNAPKDKGSLGIAYRDVSSGFNISGRMRFSSGFPAVSAAGTGTACITGGTGGIFEQDCVESFTIADFGAGYEVPNTRATLQVSVSNVFNKGYRSFAGVPSIGRFAMVRVKYDLF